MDNDAKEFFEELKLNVKRAAEIKSGKFKKRLEKFCKENNVGSTLDYELPISKDFSKFPGVKKLKNFSIETLCKELKIIHQNYRDHDH